MAESLGEKLRAAREARGIALREVADQTRISGRYLEAIEADDYKPLPGGVFNKGFIKTFARYVGVDETEAISDYARQLAASGFEEPKDDEPISRRSQVYTGDSSPRSPILTIIVALLMLGALSAAVVYGLNWWNSNASSVLTAPTPTPAATANANANVAATPAATAVNGIDVGIKAGAQDIYIVPFTDGKVQPSFILKANESRNFKGEQSVKLQCAKAYLNQLQMTINGQPANVPTVSTNPKLKNSIEFEITRENFAGYLKGNNASAQSPIQ